MRYVSTRGTAPAIGFCDVLLGGLAPDGGLYLPAEWPTLPRPSELRGRPYAEVAVEVMWPFVEGEIDRGAFEAMAADAYDGFAHPDVCPVVPLWGDLHLLQLYWGPTLAFKDVALQLVGRLFDHVLAARGERVTILGATSGDTGSAAMDACRGRERLDAVILFPDGRVSEVQRRQMTTVTDPNCHAVAVEGTFDDCQDLVKAAFADEEFRSEVALSAVNSINWARVMAQVVYYVTAHLAVAGDDDQPVSFTVPTGNFGNVLAGWAAQRMGLAIDRLVVASNRNDVLTRLLETGTMERREVVPTTSPSMDIQVSSNLERMLFELMHRDGAAVARLMAEFRTAGTVTVDADVLAGLRRHFDGGRLDDEEAASVIRLVHERTGLLVDPHTAVGIGVAESVERPPGVPMVCLATAHPAKFPDAVESAVGERPALPPHLADLFERPERIGHVGAGLAEVEALVRRVVAPRTGSAGRAGRLSS